MNTRTSVLDGKLELPEQIVELAGVEYYDVMNRMFQAMWHNYLKNKSSVSAVYWYDEFGNDVVFNKFIMHLSKAGWITSVVEPKRNWAEIYFNEAKLAKWVSKDEILKVREYNKFNTYKLGKTATDRQNTKTTAGYIDSGLKREGFKKQAKTKFKFDTDMLLKYKEAVILNTTKSIRMLELDYEAFKDDVDYKAVSTSIVESHIFERDELFCTGGSTIDSRGRNISHGLAKVFNPISSKDARALLVTEPRSLGAFGAPAVYSFVAELLGIKPKTYGDKVKAGSDAVKARKLHDLDLSTEDGRSELHENIWLERIYDAFDNYDGSNWTVPIELDFTASMLAIEGILLNHKTFLDLTNVIGEELKDAWNVEGVGRNQVKKALTPRLYGSSASTTELWKKNGISYTAQQLRIIDKELNSGRYAVANKFKDFIIANVQPQKEMTVKIWDEEFTIHCNRFRNVGDYTKRYNIYSTAKEQVLTIYHTHTHREADLKQFRRYFVTLLIHNLDSQIADTVADGVDWCIDIHDAFIVHPADARAVKSISTAKMQDMYANRERIVKDYFNSIGIDSKAATAWQEVKKHIVPLEGTFIAQPTALK